MFLVMYRSMVGLRSELTSPRKALGTVSNRMSHLSPTYGARAKREREERERTAQRQLRQSPGKFRHRLFAEVRLDLLP